MTEVMGVFLSLHLHKIHLSPCDLLSLNSKKKIEQKMMYVAFKGNQGTTNVYCNITYAINVCVRGVIIMVVKNGHDDSSSNPGRGCLHFT